MRYNQLIDELLDLLDKNLDIIKVKELQRNLLNDSNFLRDLEKYRLESTVKNKKILYENPKYIKYLESNTNINFLISDIKMKLNVFRKSGCFK